MAFYVDEEQVWKCHKHPSKRRRTGICPKCLRDRLVTLCPDCAHPRPCSCYPAPLDSSSSSPSSSLFSFSRTASRHDTNSSNIHALDPTLRKSRSVATSFLRSRSHYPRTRTEPETSKCEVERVVNNNNCLPPKVTRSKISLWGMFNKSKKCEVHDNGMDEDMNNNNNNICDDVTGSCDYSMMMRSRSVAVGTGKRFSESSSKQKGWYFPSPINAFRYSKSPRSVPVS